MDRRSGRRSARFGRSHPTAGRSNLDGRSEGTRPLAVDVRAAREALEIVPPFDRFDSADDGLLVAKLDVALWAHQRGRIDLRGRGKSRCALTVSLAFHSVHRSTTLARGRGRVCSIRDKQLVMRSDTVTARNH